MPKWTLAFLLLAFCAGVCTYSVDGDGAFFARVVCGVAVVIAMTTFVVGREDPRPAKALQ